MKKLFEHRAWVQAAASLMSNGHLSGFIQGRIYNGGAKRACVPGLNCYSCPGALGACPIGALQAVITGNKQNFSFYVVGILILFGVTLGRAICGFLCPFGWIQELLNKIPGKKLNVPKKADRGLRFFKYGVLALFVLALPMFATNAFGLGAPWFCKWICPAGTLEGGIPLLLANESLRRSVGFQFWWKFGLLALTIAFSIGVYRPFCKYVCPLGAIYALFNRFSLARLECDEGSCTACGKCARICPMGVPLPGDFNSPECIRCGKCLTACPQDAIRFSFGKLTLRQNECGDGAGK